MSSCIWFDDKKLQILKSSIIDFLKLNRDFAKGKILSYNGKKVEKSRII